MKIIPNAPTPVRPQREESGSWQEHAPDYYEDPPHDQDCARCWGTGMYLNVVCGGCHDDPPDEEA